MVKCDQKSTSSVCVVEQRAVPTAESDETRVRVEAERGASRSLARGHGDLGRTAGTLVPLFGVFLTVHHVSNPKVTPHPEVEAAVCAGVALGVAKALVCDAHGLCAVEKQV